MSEMASETRTRGCRPRPPCRWRSGPRLGGDGEETTPTADPASEPRRVARLRASRCRLACTRMSRIRFGPTANAPVPTGAPAEGPVPTSTPSDKPVRTCPTTDRPVPTDTPSGEPSSDRANRSRACSDRRAIKRAGAVQHAKCRTAVVVNSTRLPSATPPTSGPSYARNVFLVRMRPTSAAAQQTDEVAPQKTTVAQTWLGFGIVLSGSDGGLELGNKHKGQATIRGQARPF